MIFNSTNYWLTFEQHEKCKFELLSYLICTHGSVGTAITIHDNKSTMDPPKIVYADNSQANPWQQIIITVISTFFKWNIYRIEITSHRSLSIALFIFTFILSLIPVHSWLLPTLYNVQCSSGFIIVLFVWNFWAIFYPSIEQWIRMVNGWRTECEKAYSIHTFNHLTIMYSRIYFYSMFFFSFCTSSSYSISYFQFRFGLNALSPFPNTLICLNCLSFGVWASVPIHFRFDDAITQVA